jgi:NAD(P)-dependent dehydrogenase (short-subunit alcohol dehydrogenase family)
MVRWKGTGRASDRSPNSLPTASFAAVAARSGEYQDCYRHRLRLRDRPSHAEEFAKEGADVVVTYLEDQDGAEETRRRVEGAGRRALVVHLDVRDPTDVAHLFERIERNLGTPYILVNNAGIDSTGKLVAKMPLEDWDNELKTNLYGPILLLPALHPRAPGQRRARQDHQRHLGAPGDPASAPRPSQSTAG